MLGPAGLADKCAEINTAAVAAAQRARNARPDKAIAIAGSLSHVVPITAGSERVDRSTLPSAAEIEDAVAEQGQYLKQAGCDLVILEMLYDPERIAPVLRAARGIGLPIWVGFSARRGADGTILSFDRDRDIAFDALLAPLSGYPAAVAAVMHTPADVTREALSILRRHFSGPLAAYPDSGYFKMPHWQFEDVIDPGDLAGFARQWLDDPGVQIVGGCCGLGPSHIAALNTLRGPQA